MADHPGKLSGQTAIVTGASRGLGKAIALGLRDAGAYVIACARASNALNDLEKTLGAQGEIWEIDARSDAFLDRIEALSALHILVNNVGTNKPGPFEDTSDENLDLMLDLNMRATFRISRAAVRVMGAGACIINITSQMAHVGSPGRTVYCMSKHAIAGLTKAMAVELAPKGIRVNAVAPTFIETPMTKPMLDDPKFGAFVKSMIPMGKIGQPEDVSDAVVYLSSADMVTGHSLIVDGGWTAQ